MIEGSAPPDARHRPGRGDHVRPRRLHTAPPKSDLKCTADIATFVVRKGVSGSTEDTSMNKLTPDAPARLLLRLCIAPLRSCGAVIRTLLSFITAFALAAAQHPLAIGATMTWPQCWT